MNANELLTILRDECNNHKDCSGCTFYSREDCDTKCRIVNLTNGLNPLNVKFSGEHSKECSKSKADSGTTINVKNVYVCERKNDG